MRPCQKQSDAALRRPTPSVGLRRFSKRQRMVAQHQVADRRQTGRRATAWTAGRRGIERASLGRLRRDVEVLARASRA